MPRQLMSVVILAGVLAGVAACSPQTPPMGTSAAADQQQPEPRPARASRTPPVDTCSAEDLQRAEARAERAVQALLEGDTERFVRLSRAADAKLPPACRALMVRRQPAMLKCTAEERETTLSSYVDMMTAALVGDLPHYFELAEELEESLSPACWIAVNRHQDARVVQACSEQELDTMASGAGPMMRALEQATYTGDFIPMLQIVGLATSALSPACSAALSDFQRRSQMAQGPWPSPASSQVGLPSVMDHGGGTFSMSGVGGCSPTSGCVAF